MKSSSRDDVMFDLIKANGTGFSKRVGEWLNCGMRGVGIEFDDSIDS